VEKAQTGSLIKPALGLPGLDEGTEFHGQAVRLIGVDLVCVKNCECQLSRGRVTIQKSDAS